MNEDTACETTSSCGITVALDSLKLSSPSPVDAWGSCVALSKSANEGVINSTSEISSVYSIASTANDHKIDEAHDQIIGDAPSCLVIMQKACDHHKFSRKLRQRDLDNIVERPERTKAALLGILSAKALMELSGARAVDLKYCQREGAFTDKAVTDVHGSVYPQELLHMLQNAGDRLRNNQLEIPSALPTDDLYLAEKSQEALIGCLGALYDGIDNLFGVEHYLRVHVCLRPPGHHAGEDTPCGFCWINNVHVAIAYARQKYDVRRAAILDFDLHHGDGSQDIACRLNESEPYVVGYFSLHDIYSFPCENGNLEKISDASVSIAAHGHTIHNVHLQTFQTLAEFEELYTKKYSTLLDKAEQYLAEGYRRGENSLICISAGYDASEYESSNMQRHSVNLPTSFYERFTRDVVCLADKYCSGKVLSVMEGGYGNRAIAASSAAHTVGLARPEAHDRQLSKCYELEHLKNLEKYWPIKSNNCKRSGKMDDISDKWLNSIDSLHSLHLKQDNVPTKLSAEEEASSSLQKMTLRDRRPKVVATTARSAKSTPHKDIRREVDPKDAAPRPMPVTQPSTLCTDQIINTPDFLADGNKRDRPLNMASSVWQAPTQ